MEKCQGLSRRVQYKEEARNGASGRNVYRERVLAVSDAVMCRQQARSNWLGQLAGVCGG